MCLALSCKSLSEFMPKTTQKELVLTEFSDEESKFPQIVCRRDKTQNLGSCPFLGGAYHCTFKLHEYTIFHLGAVAYLLNVESTCLIKGDIFKKDHNILLSSNISNSPIAIGSP